MSFVRRSKVNQFAPKTAKPLKQSNLHIRIDVAPIPEGASSKRDPSDMADQLAAKEKIKSMGNDLFMPNPTIVSNTAGKKLYQTKDLYGNVISVENLIPQLTASDLTLRINAVREGSHSHATCMELKTGYLADILEEAADANNEKTLTLSVDGHDEKGEMYVSVRQIKGQHYINKIDYSVESYEDDKLHLK
tara:strand:- start:1470 stop:2042 length:573 start_codon:yes stop_codon:yes gene_type:complete